MYANNVTNLDRILSSLHCYVQSARVRSDVYNLLRQIPSLQPDCGTFTHNDGTTSTLLNLAGTIPIFYRGNQYNIPVELWMVETYPMASPVTFVRPTSDMMIKPGHPNVTQEGYVVVSYIQNWRQDHNLVELIAHLCSIFGNMPPVFRRPPQSQMPPPPPAYGQTQQFPYNTGQSPQNYGGYTSPSPSYGQSAAYVGASSTDYQNYSLSAMATATANVSETQNAYGGTQSNHQQNTNVTGGGEYSNSYTLQYQQQPIVAVQQQQKDPSAAIKRELTSKLQMELEKMYKRIRDDIDLQFEHQLALTDTNEKVEQGIVSLNKLREDLLEAIDKITAQDEELAQWLIQNEQKTTVDPDTIILTADVSSKQLIDALAEQQAIEDTLYFMDRALSNGEMDVAMFLKEVRKLSRKQFMCQAIMQKISEVQCQTYAPSFSSTTM